MRATPGPRHGGCGQFTLEVKQCSLGRHGRTGVRVAAASMKIAVLGGGHGCYAAAADLAEAGHDVRLWRRDEAALAAVIESGAIVLVDERGRREIAFTGATADLGAAMAGAELIVLP